MATPRQTLKQWFSRGKKPTALQFAAWIDSFWHKTEDTIQITDINGLPQTLNQKADVGHTHDASDIHNLPTTQVDTAIDPVSTNPVENQAIAAALQNKANANHSHEISDTNGLQTALNQKADDGHHHTAGEIEGLADLLNGKSDTGHTHTASDIDDFQNRVVELIDEFRPQTDPEPDIQEVVYVADAAALEQIADPSESTLYITEDTGYFYKYRDGEFELIEDNEDDGTIYCNGSFTNLDNLLKQYTRTGSYDVVLIQTSNQIATYRFVCSANSSKISQTLTKDQRDGTSANTRTRTGTIRTVNDEQVITWSSWTVRTPVYQETLDKSLSSTSNNAVKNSVIKAALDNKADLNHSHGTEYATANHNHAISDVTGLQAALDGKQPSGNYLTQHQDISGKQDKTDNSLVTVAKTIVGAIAELWNKFADYLKGIQQVTYAELVALRNNGQLVPGQQYRMTDFLTTVNANRTDIQSAGHAYDLLLVAVSSDKLSAEVKALHHTGDTYFAKSKLEAWQLWYSLDNDTMMFDLANANGKGVVFRMIDEWNNDHPFDFKNLQFRRYKLKATKRTVTIDGTDYLLKSQKLENDAVVGYTLLRLSDSNAYTYYAKYDSQNDNFAVNIDGTSFTFAASEIVETQLSAGDDEDNYPFADKYVAINNEDMEYPYGYQIDLNDSKFFYRYSALQGGVLVADSSLGLDVSQLYPGVNAIVPTVLDNESKSFVDVDNAEAILTGQAGMYRVDDSVFLGEFSSADDLTNLYVRGNKFGVEARANTFFGLTAYNDFGNDIAYNLTGKKFTENRIGNYFQRNTFGNDCDNNVFANWCYDNKFGNDCDYNQFGNYCYRNQFGNDCDYNQFGNYCYNNLFAANTHYLTLFEHVYYVDVQKATTDAGTSIEHAQILNGTHGYSDTNRLLINFATDKNYTQIAGLTTNGELRIWNPADFVPAA